MFIKPSFKRKEKGTSCYMHVLEFFIDTYMNLDKVIDRQN